MSLLANKQKKLWCNEAEFDRFVGTGKVGAHRFYVFLLLMASARVSVSRVMVKQQQGAGEYSYIVGFLLLFYVMLSVNEFFFAVNIMAGYT